MPRTRSIAWAQLKIGIIGVVAIALASTLILAVGGQGGFFWQRFPVKARFSNVMGMKSGALVRIAGNDVGKVTSVAFSGAQVEVGMELSRDVRHLVTNKSVASIGSLSLLGEPIVEITPAPEGTPVADGALLVSDQSAGAIVDAATAAKGTLDQVQDLMAGMQAGTGSLGKLMTDEGLYAEVTALATSANSLTRQIAAGKGTVGALMNDPASYTAMKASLEQLQAILEKVQRGEGPLGLLMNDPAMRSALAGTSANMEAITDRINRGHGTVGKLLTEDELYGRMDSLLVRFDALVSGLSGGQGTAGQLLQDARLYDNMNAAATSLNELIVEIKKDPRKYLTVRVSIFGG
ncbi:MAG: MCE family protein [Acidobacteria bacterium]|nr:MCE family protein [Acidobacteriota bacterium]